MSVPARVAYSFAVLRVVPHVFLGTFVNVGVILHAPTLQHLDVRLLTDPGVLRRCAPDVDLELLLRYLHACEALVRGEAAAGPVALLPPSERFHWLTAPRSDVLQCSPIHAGITDDPAATLAALFESHVLAPVRTPAQP
ncbi:MAG TPA: DUF3037 domain-containing protein [Longimicrobiales bacterium]|nr:DUF3037 domain-containing protein [Longimicrobiales bacterium]